NTLLPEHGFNVAAPVPLEQEFAGRNKEENDDVTTDFRLNGQDSEYCPEFQLNNGQLNFFKLNNISPNSVPEVCIQPKKRSKKQGCPFCKNNGEEEEFYKKHTLRDSEGRTSCPILRAYTCPICNASGDEAHTIKYCPKNKQPQNVAVMTSLKNYRNAIGQIRTKAASSSI
ncbi:Nanos 1, partial [Blattella germanica]